MKKAVNITSQGEETIGKKLKKRGTPCCVLVREVKLKDGQLKISIV